MIRNKTLRIVIDPNQMKMLEVPVCIKSETSGMVFLNENGILRPQERMIVNFYRGDSLMIGRAITGQDGSYSFTGILPPGCYAARIEHAQLWRLHLSPQAISTAFEVGQSPFGEPVSGLNILLHRQ